MRESMILAGFGMAGILAILGAALMVTRQPRRRRPKPKRTRLAEFSKRMIAALCAMWFIGALIGIAVVAVQTARGDAIVSLSDLLLYIGAPMTGGVITYLCKSAYENKEKIKRSEVYSHESMENETDQP